MLFNFSYLNPRFVNVFFFTICTPWKRGDKTFYKTAPVLKDWTNDNYAFMNLDLIYTVYQD